MKNNLKRCLAWLLVPTLLITTVAGSTTVVAAGTIDVGRSDIYNKLYEAMQVNVIANTMAKCIGSIDEYNAISASDAKSGKIFVKGLFGTGTDISTALWVEKLTQGKVDNGSIYCYQNDGTNILNQFARITDMSIDTIVCNQGSPRILSRAQYNADTGYYDAVEGNCSSFNDEGAEYIKAEDASTQFKELYNEWRSGKDNPYLPTYEKLGNFNNTDGYFSYIADFDAMCSADVVSESGKQGETDYQKIAKFTKSDNKLVVQSQYYHVNNNKTWTYALSGDNPAKSCTGLLERIAALQEISDDVGEGEGYENILINELNDACRTAINENEDKIREALADNEGQLAALNSAKISGTFYKMEGSRDDESGQIYQCVVDIDVNSYDIVDTATSTDEEITCSNSGAMSSLGWVICPILDIMNNATNVLYNDFVEPALYVDVSLFSVADSNTGSAVKSGWETFRNFANTFFIILFLVVIVSQLTGVGLNNYNIKKILPRLIVAAILINLSYVICQVCIDISNILGRGIMDFFDNIEVSMPTSVEGMGVSGFATGTLTAVILIGTILAGVWFILSAEGWSGIVVIIVLAAISIVTSLLFLFLVLAAREAAVIILVIISPVAVVAYMLPNTKTLIFDKWKKLFQNLLVVYPVCGFIVGGGNFVSKILLSAGAESGNVGFFSAFAAMLVGILPIFFIPKLVRQSLSAVGDIGTKISNFGRGVSTRGRKGAEKFAENSEHIKQWKAGSADRFQAFKNRRGMRSGNARVRARAVESESARLAANAKINRLSNPDGIRRRLSAVQAAEEDKAYDEAISQRLALMNSGGEDGGVRMRDGSRRAYTLDNMLARVREIEDDSRGRQLTADERQEFGALARGIVNEKGGAGQLHRIVRHSGETHDANGNVTGQNLNENFMQAMGDIYSQDATVKSKMREKDAGDSAYIETFMPGGAGAQPGGGRTFQDFRNSPNLNDAQGRSDYQMAIDTRVRSYEAGLNQGGEALQEYIDNLNRADCQTIRDNDELYYSMDVADRQRFDARARTLGVTGPSNTNVNIVNPGPNPGPTP